MTKAAQYGADPLDHKCPACRAAIGRPCRHQIGGEDLKLFHRGRVRVADAAEFEIYKQYLDQDLSASKLRFLAASCPHINRARQLRIIARSLDHETGLHWEAEDSARDIAVEERVSMRSVTRLRAAWRRGRLREVWAGWVRKHEGGE